MNKKRAPKHMGTGIYVHQQFEHRKDELVKGDTFFDADYGEMAWNGRKWISQEDYDKATWDQINKSWKRYAIKHGRCSFLEYLKIYYHYPHKNHRK